MIPRDEDRGWHDCYRCGREIDPDEPMLTTSLPITRNAKTLMTGFRVCLDCDWGAAAMEEWDGRPWGARAPEGVSGR